ncbi:MAG: 50S ribosomal protein L29 [Anaeroplasmataceae bacterium]|nr:50S ribosomal protein L29 [Anaeroplasmataceae bacterium]MDE5867325.1 50S ribosomal protein L29 [Anaeroplasmataceae bacterium]
MKAQDIRKLSKKQIEKKIVELKEELFNLKFQAALGNVEKPTRMHEVKKDIARLKTILTEGSYATEEAPKKKTRAKKVEASDAAAE